MAHLAVRVNVSWSISGFGRGLIKILPGSMMRDDSTRQKMCDVLLSCIEVPSTGPYS